ncbi:spermidine/putrescine-binding periplasmic protein [Citrus sinensis]|uniref:Spermidine/putrescine-binding periplasmic protein n=1 Tax=Citrus sinensis TaxID=2711 RepID=A0ACB8KHP1_CITSI|nr:spermidine/putrescine-binding periplasmic protein [Citrus sinensis]
MHHNMMNENGFKDWKDLWLPELAGRISMVNSPREQAAAGRIAVQQNLALLGNQVRLFDRTHYLKVFGIGDVWIAVGWSSDVLPAVKRMSNVAVVVPKSGASLWADLWAIPAASRLETKQIGGRVREFEKKDHEANATDFFIIVASIVEVSSFEAVYAYAFSLLNYRKLKN